MSLDRKHDRLVRLPEVMHRTGLCRATIYKKIAAGQFPASTKISAYTVAWYESDLDAWIAAPMEWKEAA